MLGQYDDAVGQLQTVLRTDPANFAVRRRLAQRLKLRSRWRDLEQLNDESVKLYPQNMTLYLEIGNTAVERAEEYARKGMTP